MDLSKGNPLVIDYFTALFPRQAAFAQAGQAGGASGLVVIAMATLFLCLAYFVSILILGTVLKWFGFKSIMALEPSRSLDRLPR